MATKELSEGELSRRTVVPIPDIRRLSSGGYSLSIEMDPVRPLR